MERSTREIQVELDAAQADLERKVAQLKHFADDKLETPRKVLHAVEKPLSMLRAHKRFVVVVGMMAVALGTLAVRRVRRW